MCDIKYNDTNIDVVIGNEFPKKVIPLIEAADRFIKIIVFDWRWYPRDVGCACQQFNQAIIQAGKRGVDVQAITNIIEIINVLRANNIKGKKPQSKKLLHSKLMIIDEQIAVLGSHNYTQNAFTMNYEVSTIISNKQVAARFSGYFQTLWGL